MDLGGRTRGTYGKHHDPVSGALYRAQPGAGENAYEPPLDAGGRGLTG